MNAEKNIFFGTFVPFSHGTLCQNMGLCCMPVILDLLTLQGKKGRPGEDGSPGLKGQKVLALYFHYYSAKLVCS